MTEPSDLVPGDCLIYTGQQTADGYGLIKVPTGERGGRTVLLHRLAYELLVGPIPEGLTIDHLCRRPACYNAAHLEAVTQLENQLRGVAATRPLCPRGHQRTPNGRGRQTRCLPCENEQARARRARRRAAA